MPPYEKEIKAAQKIADDWVRNTSKYRDAFVSIKKDSVKIEKITVKKVQDGIAKKLHVGDRKLADEYWDDLENLRKNFELYLAEGQRMFKEHDTWKLKVPRANMGAIAPQLKSRGMDLGPATGEKYQAVSKALDHVLTDVARELSLTDKAWEHDVKFAIDTHLKTIGALEKVLKGGATERNAYAAQLKAEETEFSAFCTKGVLNLKLSADQNTLAEVKGGKLRGKDAAFRKQKTQVYVKKLEMANAMSDQMIKNQKRILKSVPEEYKVSMLFKAVKARLEALVTKTDAELRDAVDYYQDLIIAFDDDAYFQ